MTKESKENWYITIMVFVLIFGILAVPWIIGFAIKYLNFVYNFFELQKIH